MVRERKRQRGKVRRAAKRERRQARRKGRGYQAWRHLTQNQQEVAKCLSAGQIDLVTVSGWGFVSSFLVYLDSFSAPLQGCGKTGAKIGGFRTERLIRSSSGNG